MSAAAVKTAPATEPVKAPTSRTIAVKPKELPPEMATMYKVRDKLATHGPRVHELVDARGMIQKLVFPSSDVFIDVPMPLAAKLIGNDGFQVLNERDHEMRVQKIEMEGANTGVFLSYDEIVAKYEELTHEALLTRATKAGGKFTGKNKKEEIISYLIEVSLDGADRIAQAEGDEDFDLEEENEFA